MRVCDAVRSVLQCGLLRRCVSSVQCVLPVLWVLCVPVGAHAMDLSATRKLHDEKCVGCHAQKSAFGDPDAIYKRTDSTVKNLQRLKTMVSLCNSELRLDLFPEDEQDLVVYLNQTYYHFKP